METILSTQEEENLINLFRLKNRVYNNTFRNFVNTIENVNNINFVVNAKYEDIDFTTVVIDRNINCNLLQDNIFFTNYILTSLDKELENNYNLLQQILENCNNYSKLKTEDKKLFVNCYLIARYIQVICSKDFYKTCLENHLDVYLDIEDEIKPRFWLSCKIYFKNLFKNYDKNR